MLSEAITFTRLLGCYNIMLKRRRHSYAVSIKKDDSVVGLIGHGGTIGCEVTGHRKKGKGLEVPCKYSFTDQKKIMLN